jgi:hypothetical protein
MINELLHTHSIIRYMFHEIRLSRIRTGPSRFGYKLIVYSLQIWGTVHARELDMGYDQAKKYAKDWIEKEGSKQVKRELQ